MGGGSTTANNRNVWMWHEKADRQIKHVDRLFAFVLFMALSLGVECFIWFSSRPNICGHMVSVVTEHFDNIIIHLLWMIEWELNWSMQPLNNCMLQSCYCLHWRFRSITLLSIHRICSNNNNNTTPRWVLNALLCLFCLSLCVSYHIFYLFILFVPIFLREKFLPTFTNCLTCNQL